MPVEIHPVRLTGDEAHRLADMAGIRDDLRAAAAAARRNYREPDQGLRNQVILEALQDSALIRYRRAFSTGVRTAFRVPSAWIEGLPADLRVEHVNFLALRDKHIAHSVNDWELNEPVAQVAIDQDTGAVDVRAVNVNQSRVLLMSYHLMQTLECLATTLADRLEAEIKDEEQKLLAIAKQIPTDELKRRIAQDEPRWAGDGKDLSKPRSRG